MSSPTTATTPLTGEAGPFRLVTDRLVLRRWQESDLEAWADLCADHEVMRYLPPGPIDRETAKARAALYDGDFATNALNGHHFGLAALERRADGVFLGFTGLHRHRWYPEDLEIGWRLDRFAWGHGYATEAATACVQYAFDTLAVPRVIAVIMTTNERSRAVAERLGMVVDHQTVREDIEIVVYRLTKARYELQTAR